MRTDLHTFSPDVRMQTR